MNPLPPTTPAARVLAGARAGGRPSLGPASPRAGGWREELAHLSDQELLGAGPLADRGAAACVRAGLLLFGDDLEASHAVSQSVETPDGSWWHGILHRREPDYGNAKYWFRRVGGHPVEVELAAALKNGGAAAREVLRGGGWDAFRLVDLVEACEAGRRPELREELLAIQEAEMLHLLAHCYKKALGDAGPGRAKR